MSACSPLQLSASFKRYYDQLRDPASPPVTTPLHVSVLNGDYTRVLRLVTKQGVDPRVTDQVECCPQLMPCTGNGIVFLIARYFAVDWL
jgi:hypothetical protein